MLRPSRIPVVARHARRWQSALTTGTADAPDAPTFHFKCTACGKCCTGKGGRVRVNTREIEELRALLKISLAELKDKYLTQSKEQGEDTWLIKQTPDDKQCTFLDGKRCSVYAARPTQCRTFPWWPLNLISNYDWQLTARDCEGVLLAPNDRDSVGRSLVDVFPEAIVYDIHRSGENYTYDELHGMLHDLQEVDPTFVEQQANEFRSNFQRRIVYQDDSITVLDTMLEGILPTRGFVFNDRLHLMQSEMLLHSSASKGGGSSAAVAVVDPSELVFDVHKAMCLALPWLPTAKGDWKIALLGSGGGSLVRYLLHHHGQQVTQLDAVEPSGQVNQIARQFFGLSQDEHKHPSLTIHEVFGENFVTQQQQQAKRPKYDLFLIDVEAGSPQDGISAPPVSMLTADFLRGVWELLGDTGVVVMNVITEDRQALQRVAMVVQTAVTDVGCGTSVYVELPKNAVFYLFKNPPEEERTLKQLQALTQGKLGAGMRLRPLQVLLE